MKHKVFFSFIALVIAISCSRDHGSSRIPVVDTLPSTISINSYELNRYLDIDSKIIDQIFYSNDFVIPMYFSKVEDTGPLSNLRSLNLSFINSRLENLNSAIASEFVNRIVALSTLSSSDEDLLGVILYFVGSDGSLQVANYSKDPTQINVYKLIHFPAKYTTGISLKDILFLSRGAFEQYVSNIETIGVSDLSILNPTNRNDDLNLLYFAVKNNLKKSQMFYYNFINSYNPVQFENTSYKVQGSGGGEGCGLTHHCRDNTLGPNCQPFAGGCRNNVDCSYNEMLPMYYSFQLEDYSVVFLANLIDISLYEFADNIAQTTNGMFYIDAYYNLSESFLQTVDASILIDISVASLALSDFVDAMNTNDSSYVLSSNDYNLFIGVLQQSMANSDNQIYQAIIADILDRLSEFEGKSVSQIYAILNL